MCIRDRIGCVCLGYPWVSHYLPNLTYSVCAYIIAVRVCGFQPASTSFGCVWHVCLLYSMGVSQIVIIRVCGANKFMSVRTSVFTMSVKIILGVNRVSCSVHFISGVTPTMMSPHNANSAIGHGLWWRYKWAFSNTPLVVPCWKPHKVGETQKIPQFGT